MAKDSQNKTAYKNYITPAGFEKLQDEYDHLFSKERPELVKVIEWAAGNGDRSENADYIYGKRRLREIDRRLRFLNGRIEKAEVVDITQQTQTQKVFFGATITLEDEDGESLIVQIVGEDEIDTKKGKISWVSPMAKAVLGKSLDDEITVKRPVGRKTYTIMDITYRSSA